MQEEGVLVVGENNWATIGEVSKNLDIDGARLRDWCKKGLIEHDMRSNTRYIPESEIGKIVKIRDFFQAAKDAGTRKTFDDVREMLEKEDLYYNQQQDLHSREEIKRYENSIQEAIKNIGLENSLLFLAERLRDLPTKSEMTSFFERVEKQKLLEDLSAREELEKVEEQLEKSNAQNEEMAKMMEKMTAQMTSIESELKSLKEDSAKDKDAIKPEKKGIFRRFFE